MMIRHMTSFLITCSHATCAVPEAFRELFQGAEDAVTSVEGWEPGALNLAQGLAMKFSTPLIHGDVTRLLIDLDQTGEGRWSKISATLPEPTREKLVDRHEVKFRQAIEGRLAEEFRRANQVTHLIIHTAPLADGTVLLEHAGGPHAAKLADTIVKGIGTTEILARSTALGEKTPFIKWLTDSFSCPNYGIIRITVSQSFFLKSVPLRWETAKKAIIQSVVRSAG
jgi:hypothetical protein